MSLPEYLVLGSDGTIGAYGRLDILQCDLVVNLKAGRPARGVWRLQQTLQVSYAPAPEFANLVRPLENLCARHKSIALPPPTQALCTECAREGAWTG